MNEMNEWFKINIYLVVVILKAFILEKFSV